MKSLRWHSMGMYAAATALPIVVQKSNFCIRANGAVSELSGTSRTMDRPGRAGEEFHAQLGSMAARAPHIPGRSIGVTTTRVDARAWVESTISASPA